MSFVGELCQIVFHQDNRIYLFHGYEDCPFVKHASQRQLKENCTVISISLCFLGSVNYP